MADVGQTKKIVQSVPLITCEAPESFGEVLFSLRRFLDTKLIGLGFAAAEPSLAVLFLSSLGDYTVLSVRMKMGARKHREIHDVQQSKKMVPVTKCTITFASTCEWFFWCQCIRFGFWVSKLILSKNQSSATLWVLETHLIVGLLPLMIILITVSSSSTMYN